MECQAEEMGISDEFYRGVKESDAARTSFLVYRESDIEKEAVRKWFCRFKKYHFDMNNYPRSRLLSNFDNKSFERFS